MDLFLSWDVLWGKNDPDVAALDDDPERLRRQNQQVEAARRVWESYFLTSLGAPISFDGAAGRGQVPAEAIEGLEKVRRQIEQILEHVDLGVGVGMKISEADQALKLAMKRGGTVIFYTDEVPKALGDKEGELSKADPPVGPSSPPNPTPPTQTAENSVAAGGGFSGATQPGGAAAAQSPAAEASEHSQGEAMAQVAEDAPGSPELTHAGADFQDQFQQSADGADQEDQQKGAQADQGSAVADLKTSVLQVLKQLRAQAPVIEQMRLLEPQLYQAVTAVTQVMVSMAKQLLGQAPVKKSEPKDVDPVIKADLLFTEAAFRSKDGRVITTGGLHDIGALPEDFEVADEGFVGRDGQFYTGAEATKIAGLEKKEINPPDFAGAAPPKDATLHKLEYFRAKDGIRIPTAASPTRRDWDKRFVAKIKDTWGYLGQLRGKKVDIGELAHTSSGNRVVNQDRYKLYRRMLAQGDRLPPIVIRRNGMKYDIIDGSHRCQAAIDHGVGNLDAIEISGMAKMDDMPGICDTVKAASEGECDHFYGNAKKCLRCKKDRPDELEKAKLPLPENAPKHVERQWPVGTVKDSSPGGTREVGKVKVQHPEDGKTSWVEVRAGQVMSQDGHPISSRNPGGR